MAHLRLPLRPQLTLRDVPLHDPLPLRRTFPRTLTAPFPLTRFSARSALISALLACYGYTALSLIVNRYFSYANVSQGSCGNIYKVWRDFTNVVTANLQKNL